MSQESKPKATLDPDVTTTGMPSKVVKSVVLTDIIKTQSSNETVVFTTTTTTKIKTKQ